MHKSCLISTKALASIFSPGSCHLVEFALFYLIVWAVALLTLSSVRMLPLTLQACEYHSLL